MSLPVSSHNQSASRCSPSSRFVPLPSFRRFGRPDRSLRLLFYPRRTVRCCNSTFSLFPSSSLSLSLSLRVTILEKAREEVLVPFLRTVVHSSGLAFWSMDFCSKTPCFRDVACFPLDVSDLPVRRSSLARKVR